MAPFHNQQNWGKETLLQQSTNSNAKSDTQLQSTNGKAAKYNSNKLNTSNVPDLSREKNTTIEDDADETPALSKNKTKKGNKHKCQLL